MFRFQSPSSGSVLFELAEVIVIKISIVIFNYSYSYFNNYNFSKLK